MLKVFLLFILLIAGIVLGPMLAGHRGYVLIQTDNYNIETSVTGLVIILILGVVVLLAVEWLLRRIFRTGVHTRGWFVGRKRRRARKQTEQALLKLAEGDYQQVEKLMSKMPTMQNSRLLTICWPLKRRNSEAMRPAPISILNARLSSLLRIRFRLRSPAFVCNWRAMKTMPHVTALTVCWKLPLVTRKCCVLLSRHIFGPVPGARCWTLSLPWRKPTWAMMNIVMNFSVWHGLA